MEVAECINTSVTDNMGRRGLHFRRPREVNVAKALGEDYNIENRRPSVTGTGLGTAGGTSGTVGVSAGTGSKYQPKIYIPERVKASMEGSKPASQSTAAAIGMSPFGGSTQSAYNMSTPSAYGAGMESAYNVGGTQPAYSGYSSRVVHGHNPAATDPNSTSLLSTSRGLFQLRPRRCIRVKSFDELEMDENKRPSEETSRRQTDGGEPTYTTGFLKDSSSGSGVGGGGGAGTSSRDRLARRGRHSISDMLGSSTMGLAPAFIDADGGGRTEPSFDHSRLERPDFRLGLHDPGLDGPQQPAQELGQDVGTQPSEQVAPQEVITGITELTENLNNLNVDGLVTGVRGHENEGHFVNGEERFVSERPLPDVISSQALHHQAGYVDSVPSFRQNGYQMDEELAGGSREETIDEKKERILRNLYAQKMAAASGMSMTTISDPNFETLEQKKERIFAALRQKHGVQIQTQMLGRPLLAEGWPVPNPLLHVTSSPIGQSPTVDRPQTGHMLALDGPQSSQSASSAFHASQSPSRNEMPTGQSLHSRLADRERDSYKDRMEMLNKDNTSMTPSDRQTGHLDLINDNVQRLSPNEDMCSVDSGFHGGETGHEDSPGASSSTSGTTPAPSADRRQEGPSETKIETETSKSEEILDKQNEQEVGVVRDRVRDEVKSEQSEDDSHDECLIKPSAVKATGSMLLKKSAPPPTKPKPKPKAGKPSPIRLPSGQAKPQHARSGSQTPMKPAPQQSQARSQPPRPKSAPPNKSRSFANLSEVANISLSSAQPSAGPAAGRRASTSSGGSDAEAATPFSRNSRLRSSTKAWELRQAERRAELAKNKTPSRPPKAPLATGQSHAGTPKKQIGLSPERSAASSTPTSGSRPGTPKRQLSVESTSSDSTAGDRQKNYEKPWRTGSMLATKSVGSFTIRSAQPDRSAGGQQSQQPQRPRKPLSTPSSRSASRTQSPAGRPRQK